MAELGHGFDPADIKTFQWKNFDRDYPKSLPCNRWSLHRWNDGNASLLSLFLQFDPCVMEGLTNEKGKNFYGFAGNQMMGLIKAQTFDQQRTVFYITSRIGRMCAVDDNTSMKDRAIDFVVGMDESSRSELWKAVTAQKDVTVTESVEEFLKIRKKEHKDGKTFHIEKWEIEGLNKGGYNR